MHACVHAVGTEEARPNYWVYGCRREATTTATTAMRLERWSSYLSIDPGSRASRLQRGPNPTRRLFVGLGPLLAGVWRGVKGGFWNEALGPDGRHESPRCDLSGALVCCVSRYCWWRNNACPVSIVKGLGLVFSCSCIYTGNIICSPGGGRSWPHKWHGGPFHMAHEE